MPTLNYPYYASGYQTQYSDVKLGTDLIIQYSKGHTKIIKPDTIRRKRPVDLFRNGTNRSWTIERYEIAAPATTTTKLSGGTMTQSWYYLVPITGSPMWPNYSALKSQILSKIKGQKVDLAVLGAELGKTTDMFFGLCRSVIAGFRKLLSLRREALKALNRLSRSVRRKSYWSRKYRRLTKQISNLWLQYAYGWKPLASDIWELSQALQAPHNEGDKTVTASVRERKTEHVAGYGVFRTITVQLETEVRAKARFKVESRVVSRAQQLGLTNPASVAWELIPFSFIIDYLIDVGDFLGNLDALANTSDASWYRSSRTFHQCSGESMPTGYMRQTPGYSWWSKEVLERTAAAPLTWSLNVTLDGAVNLPRTANIVALLRQQMRF